MASGCLRYTFKFVAVISNLNGNSTELTEIYYDCRCGGNMSVADAGGGGVKGEGEQGGLWLVERETKQ